ncbi:MAG: DUF805 domain-containing protein [Alphaproteobacteria bacterium]|nr:DUF805 domain-containing protein [Alphaproteobacteria bacterium]
MQGSILSVDWTADNGIIRGEDGVKYSFDFSDFFQGSAFVGNVVDFEVKNGKASEIYVVKTSLSAKIDYLFWFLFSVRGRISRDHFLIWLLAACFLMPIPVALGVLKITGLGAVATLLASYVSYAVILKRLHDSNASAVWIIITLLLALSAILIQLGLINLPLLNGIGETVYIIVACLFAFFCVCLCLSKGSFGVNKYGKKTIGCKTIRLK